MSLRGDWIPETLPSRHDHVGHMVYGTETAYCRSCDATWHRDDYIPDDSSDDENEFISEEQEARIDAGDGLDA